ncbi:MAG: hypothetical protein KDE31_31895, partial [Caldilineaceae bacterium]|nr:hypothetical protein [Caldilineaceae bacterium]
MMEFDPRRSAVRSNPYPCYAQLRTHDPVHYRPQNDDWIFTRYADLTALLTDKRVGYCPAKTTQEAPP